MESLQARTSLLTSTQHGVLRMQTCICYNKTEYLSFNANMPRHIRSLSKL